MYVEGGGREKTGKDEAEREGKSQIIKDFISPIKEFILKTKMNN